jgi:predicted lactoylglutathione lyase
MDRRPPPLANTITLGVQNLDAQRAFYGRLGWPLVFDSDDFTVFELRGALLALFPVEKLAADSQAQPELSRGGIRFSIIISVDKPEDVDELAARVLQAGGKLTKDPVDAEFFVGRDAYFMDPEGNFWEIACAPPDNPVVIASRRAAGLRSRPKRVKAARKGGGREKKRSARRGRRRVS